MTNKFLEQFMPKYTEDFSDLSEGMELDPVSGDEIVGVLTDEEIELFKNLAGIDIRQQELIESTEDIIRQTTGRAIIRAKETYKQLNDKIAKAVEDSGDMDELLYIQSLQAKVRGEFWFNLRKRLQNFTHKLDVRSGYKVVSLGKKKGVH